MSELRLELKGLREEQARMTQIVADLHGEPMLQGMRNATLLVTRDAKINAPVDTGRLRASITPEVRVSGPTTVQGIVGSNVMYAPFVELGTKPHFPPVGALAVWARRHGTTAFLVARAISRRGTKAVKYLERAITENRERIVSYIGDAVARIVRGD